MFISFCGIVLTIVLRSYVRLEWSKMATCIKIEALLKYDYFVDAIFYIYIGL